MSSVCVLGSGVLGLSVGAALRCAGHEVSVWGSKTITDASASDDPFFASAYPAASIIPHTVNASGLSELVRNSGVVFSALTRAKEAGVRLQRHYELSEEGLSVPDYADSLIDLKICKHSESPITRAGAECASGYSFSCIFCDMPKYARWLVNLSESSGVHLKRAEITHSWLQRQNVDFYVNCLGSGAYKVFSDINPGVLVRGILVLAEFQCPSKNIASYNYTPHYSIYPSGDGLTPSDVYFYPRSGHCVLGGTRQIGRRSPDGTAFIAENELTNDAINILGVQVPRPIIELNSELVFQLTGAKIGPPIKSLVGYRHLDTDDRNRTRVSLGFKDRTGLPPVYDCFGFGGAGVTLSWGAALSVANAIASHAGIGKLEAEQVAAYILQCNNAEGS